MWKKQMWEWEEEEREGEEERERDGIAERDKGRKFANQFLKIKMERSDSLIQFSNINSAKNKDSNWISKDYSEICCFVK